MVFVVVTRDEIVADVRTFKETSLGVGVKETSTRLTQEPLVQTIEQFTPRDFGSNLKLRSLIYSCTTRFP